MVKTIETRHQHGKTTKGGAGGDRDEGNRGKVMPPLITKKPLDESGAGGAEIMVVMMQIKQKKQGRGEVDGEEKMMLLIVLVAVRIEKRWDENGVGDDGVSCLEKRKGAAHINRGEGRVSH